VELKGIEKKNGAKGEGPNAHGFNISSPTENHLCNLGPGRTPHRQRLDAVLTSGRAGGIGEKSREEKGCTVLEESLDRQ